LCEEVHDVCGRASVSEEVGHGAEVGFGVGEEFLVGGAEVVEAGVAVGGEVEAVFWAFAVAVAEELAALALGGEGGVFVGAELGLFGGVDHFGEGGGEEVAAFVGGVDEVVAGVEVSVVFEGEACAAGLGEDAEGGGVAHFDAELGVEELDEVFADVVADPFVEDGAEESAELEGFDGPWGDLGVGCEDFELRWIGKWRVGSTGA